MGPQWVGFTKQSRHKKDWSKIQIAFLEKSPNNVNLSLVPWRNVQPIAVGRYFSWRIWVHTGWFRSVGYWILPAKTVQNGLILDVPKGEFPPHKMSFRELSMILLGGWWNDFDLNISHVFFCGKNGETNMSSCLHTISGEFELGKHTPLREATLWWRSITYCWWCLWRNAFGRELMGKYPEEKTKMMKLKVTASNFLIEDTWNSYMVVFPLWC